MNRSDVRRLKGTKKYLMQLIEHRYNLNVVLLERASKRPQFYFSGVSDGQDILEKNLTFI